MNGHPRWTNQIRFVPERLADPLRWTRPRRIFVNSMSDLGHPDLPVSVIAQILALIAACPQHTFQVLTKRPERLRAVLTNADTLGLVHDTLEAWFANIYTPPPHSPIPGGEPAVSALWRAMRRQDQMPFSGRRFRRETLERLLVWPLPQLWIGTSVENQATAEERIPHLLATPAAVRFLSCEPLLDPLNLELLPCRLPHQVQTGTLNALTGEWWPADGYDPEREYRGRDQLEGQVDWVIVGGESGPNARAMDPAWAADLLHACAAAAVPTFFKQAGEGLARVWRCRDRKGGDPGEWPAAFQVRAFPAAGRPDSP